MTKRVRLNVGEHSHKCESCGTVWKHKRPGFNCSSAERVQMHLCPMENCRQEQWIIHKHGPEPKKAGITVEDLLNAIFGEPHDS